MAGHLNKGEGAKAWDLLVEIGVEELPARFVGPAIDQLKTIVESGLGEIRLPWRAVDVYGTPRRLALIVRGVSRHQEPTTNVFYGPPKSAALDGEGKPTAAALGFAKKCGVSVGELSAEETPKGERLCAKVHEEGRPSTEVLPAAIASWIERLSFPKSMVWNSSGFRFARPIRWLLAILGDRPLPVKLAGISSGTTTRGHRFSSGEVAVPSAESYAGLLREAGVIVDQNERRRMIEDGLRREASKLGGAPIEDEGLLEEVTYLVELPTVVLGGFTPSNTKMPREVVIAAMREHQRYFAIEGADGSLLPNFLTVLNAVPQAVEGSIEGNERVLEARLADARFYWERDLSKGLKSLLEGLGGITWHAGLGTLLDKSKRLQALSAPLAERWCPEEKEAVERAALLCKADLASDMVKDGKEFTGLQGAIGGEYALRWGEPREVAAAVKEHYLPRFAGDALPDSVGGAILSITDRVDNIVGGFAAGVAPTGSEDPYALRRAANGIVRILLEKDLHVSMVELFELSCSLLREGTAAETGGLLEKVLEYWVSRGDSCFAERDVPYDIADSVLSVSFDDPVDSWKRCRALVRFREEESFSALVIGFKRAANILRNVDEDVGISLESANLNHEAERKLLAGTNEAWRIVEEALSRADYEKVIETQLGLRPAIDRFFDDVLVMEEDPRVRRTRLAILRRVHELFLKTWDLSKIALET